MRFSPKFSQCARYFSPKLYKAHAIFHQFSDVKTGNDPNHEASSVSWLPVNSIALALALLRKANLIFYWIRLTSATLFSIVFFAYCVHKLNYIKNVILQNQEHGTPRNNGGTTENYWNTTKNNTEQPHKTKNSCCVFKRKFRTQNFNFPPKVKTLVIADINYLFKVGLHVGKKKIN